MTTNPQDPNDLLLYKAVPSRSIEQLACLEKAARQARSISTDGTYSETDVREEVISKIVEFLGYEKGTLFSVDREKPLKIGVKGSGNPDYAMNVLGVKYHWILEAKKPPERDRAFKPEELLQALGYSAHPNADAAIIILCNGRRFTAFDREVSMVDPIMDFLIEDICDYGDHLLAWLGPWQIAFFEKRRALRAAEKSLAGELVPGRIREFRDKLNEICDKATRDVWPRRQALSDRIPSTEDTPLELDVNLSEIIDSYFHAPITRGDFNKIDSVIKARTGEWAFPILHKALEEHPRLLTPDYIPNLLSLCRSMQRNDWRPSISPRWLRANEDWDSITRALLEVCLTRFEDYEEGRVLLALSTGMHRLVRCLEVIVPLLDGPAQQQFELSRYFGNELSIENLIDSPESRKILLAKATAYTVSERVARQHRDNRGKLKIETLKQFVRQIWRDELNIISHTSYAGLAAETGIAEWSNVTNHGRSFDWQLHGSLCIVAEDPVLAKWVISNKLNKVQLAARMGSHGAQKILGEEKQSSWLPLEDQWFANRFFLGDLDTYTQLNKAYSRR